MLQKEISKFIEEGYDTQLTSFLPDMPALAKYSDDETWSRVRIRKEISDTEVQVFFADFGGETIAKKCELLAIPDRFLMKIPFQAIECSLYGIKFDTIVNKDIADYIYNLGRGTDDSFKKVFAKPIESLERGIDSAGKHYKVLLYAQDETEENKFFSISKELISRQLGTNVEDAIESGPEFFIQPIAMDDEKYVKWLVKYQNDEELSDEPSTDDINTSDPLLKIDPESAPKDFPKVSVTWWQTKTLLILELRINQAKTQNFELAIEDNSLTLGCNFKVLFIEFFSAVDVSSVDMSDDDALITIVLKKVSAKKWERLTKGKDKNKHIKQNLTAYIDSEDETELPEAKTVDCDFYKLAFNGIADPIQEELQEEEIIPDTKDLGSFTEIVADSRRYDF